MTWLQGATQLRRSDHVAATAELRIVLGFILSLDEVTVLNLNLLYGFDLF